MSDAGTIEADAIPRHCTRCDYPLAGLPAEGVCPECGTAYDDRFIVLRGHALAGGPAAARSRKIVWIVVAAFAFDGCNNALQALRHVRSGSGWQAAGDFVLLAMWIGFAARMIYQGYGKSGPPGELWLCAEGFLIRANGDETPARPTTPIRFSRPAIWIVSVACALTAIMLFASRSPLAVTPVVLAVFLAAIAYAAGDVDRRLPMTRSVTPPGFDSPLSVVAWRPNSIFTVDALPKKGDAFRFEIVTPRAPAARAKPPRAARFVAALDETQARNICRRVDDWIAAAGRGER